MFSYTVRCTFSDAVLVDEWIAWLRDEHLADMCAVGALDAEVVRFDPEKGRPGVAFEVRYHYESRAAFEAYVRDHAERLRGEGQRRFPQASGLRYERITGEVVAQFERAAS